MELIASPFRELQRRSSVFFFVMRRRAEGTQADSRRSSLISPDREYAPVDPGLPFVVEHKCNPEINRYITGKVTSKGQPVLRARFVVRLLQFIDGFIENIRISAFHSYRVERLKIDVCNIFAGNDQKR